MILQLTFFLITFAYFYATLRNCGRVSISAAKHFFTEIANHDVSLDCTTCQRSLKIDHNVHNGCPETYRKFGEDICNTLGDIEGRGQGTAPPPSENSMQQMKADVGVS